MSDVLFSENAPAAIGPYSQGREINGLCFFSGIIPLDPKTGELVNNTFNDEVEQVFRNMTALLKDNNLDFNRVMKTTVFLADMGDFPALNEIYGKYFTKPYPARSCVAVKTLPKNVRVEIEIIAAR